MTFEQAVSLINDNGFLVNNCFQLQTGIWRASVYNQEWVSSFAEGPTPATALLNAWNSGRSLERCEPKSKPSYVKPTKTAASPSNPTKISLEMLGLVRKE